MTEHLLVTIRCTNQSFKDMNVEVESTWSVANLKSHLQNVFPSNPDAKKQRLIYAGQLMKENERLSTYFKRQPADHFPIVHLVCAPSHNQQVLPPADGLRHRKPAQQTQQNVSQTQQPPVTLASDAQASQIPFGNVPFYAAPVADPAWQQTQQMYNAYMMQYMQYLQQLYGPAYWPWAMGGGMATMVSPTIVNAPQTVLPVPGDAQANVQAPAQQQPQAGAAGQGQQAMNAQGGVDDDDDVRNRDWLDWLYMGCRAGLLVTILYFYSSMERFTFVMLCCLMIYGYQAGWFGRRRNNEPANQRQVEPDANQAPNDPRQPPNDVQAPTEPGNQVYDEPQTAWHVFWSTCWTFVSSFFSSLVPQRPPPMNLN